MRKIFAIAALISSFFSVNAQMNRSNQASNISSNIYQNTSHAITGTILQQVMLNQNNSYVNLLSDTNLLDVRNFCTTAVYTPGMGCFHNDTLYRNITTAHGSWSRVQWQPITGTSLGCYIACSDTGKSVVTYHALDSAYNSHCYLACSDTGKSVVSYHALDSAFSSHCFIACSDTGTSVATYHTVSVATATLIPFADTVVPSGGSAKISTPHQVFIATSPLIPFFDTGGGLGPAKIATPYYVAIHAGSSSWSLTGNSGTTPGTDFVGTSDNEPLYFKIDDTLSGGLTTSAQTPASCTSLGYLSLRFNTGNNNTAVGQGSMKSNTTGNNNTAFGQRSLNFNTTGIYNTACGQLALLDNTTGSYNAATGQGAAEDNTTGSYNTVNGYSALGFNLLGSNNTAIGAFSLALNQGINNTGCGFGALYPNHGGSSNTGLGYNAGNNNIGLGSGDGNVYVGDSAGYNNPYGSYNIYIGYQAMPGAGTYNNSIGIGYGATVTASNQIVFGNGSITQMEFNGALMPFYSSSYHAGTSGQVLTSQGTGVAPQWGSGLLIQDDSVFVGQNIKFDTVHGKNELILDVSALGSISDTATINLPSNPGNNQLCNFSFWTCVGCTPPNLDYISVRTTDNSTIILCNPGSTFNSPGKYFKLPRFGIISFQFVYDSYHKSWIQK